MKPALAALALAGMVCAGSAGAQQARPQPIMELPALLQLFLLPEGAPDGSVLGWDAGTGEASRIRWAFDGVRDAEPHQQREGFPSQRVGLVIVSVAGEPAYIGTYQGRRIPGVWRVTLLGPRAGPFRVDVSTEGDADEMTLDLPALLAEAGWSVTAYKCSRETSPAVVGHVVHTVRAPGRKPVWLHERWNWGSGTGMTVAVSLLYFQEDADKVECITRPDA
jgi:hypothetical protein